MTAIKKMMLIPIEKYAILKEKHQNLPYKKDEEETSGTCSNSVPSAPQITTARGADSMRIKLANKRQKNPHTRKGLTSKKNKNKNKENVQMLTHGNSGVDVRTESIGYVQIPVKAKKGPRKLKRLQILKKWFQF